MSECQCSEESGPCEQHADILVVRQGAALHSADELTLLLVSDLMDCGVKLTISQRAQYERLDKALVRDTHTGVARFDDPDDFDDAVDLFEHVESNAEGLWVTHEDGYTIARPHEDCPL